MKKMTIIVLLISLLSSCMSIQPPKIGEPIGNQEGSRVAVAINSFAVSPLKVKRGSSITVNLQYTVTGAASKGVRITAYQDLIFDGAENIRLDSQKMVWKNGVWERSSSFMVPASAKPGKYKVKQSIITKDNMLQVFAFFTVIRQKAVKRQAKRIKFAFNVTQKKFSETERYYED